MSNKLEEFKKIIEQMFQFDQADLDFGIYRIMNQKRAEVKRFLDEDLLPQVKEEFNKYIAGDREIIQKQMDELKRNLENAGVLAEESPKYRELQEQYWQAADVTALENEVYSHLTNFFKRYYHNGDFLSLRRYKKDVYAIPYEGEEVKLHWANADQYYIKTSEYLRDYTFTLPSGGRIHFKLVEASTEQNNNKASNGKERRFILAREEPVVEENGELFIRFHYELLDKKTKQAELNAQAIKTVFKEQVVKTKWHELATLMPTEKNKKRTLLEKHLTDYTARHTFDYFIHKDLGGFLRRELDFFIKNEIMHLDDLGTEKEIKLEQYIAKIRVVKKIGYKIIRFLEQLENFQKKLWLKKKFVVETNYCITLDRVPEELYPEIAANKEQVAEWRRLFAIEEIEGDGSKPGYSDPLTVEFLKANPYLVLDTVFFGQEFKEQLLASIDNLDEQIDGLLVCSENFQALNLLQERYRGRISIIHIDPPYNTATSGFLYKNGYEHSSWLTMMKNRIDFSINMLSEDASYLCHIDENEYEKLHLIFDNPQTINAGTLIWDKRNPMNGGNGLATQHEYVIWRVKQRGPIYIKNTNVISMLSTVQRLIKSEGGINDNVRKKYVEWINNNTDLSGGEKAYRYIDDEGRIYQSVSLRAPEPREDPKFHQPLIHPVTKKPCAIPPNGFSRTPETLNEMVKRGEILFGEDETTQPRQKVFLTEESKRQMSTVLQDAKKGKSDTDLLGINFPYCHPVSFYKTLIGAAVKKLNGCVVLDFFAGSGTTAHAVINLNREDGGMRKYILVEMGEYFATVLKPRIQKVIYSKDWKAGKPVSREGSSHMFKYIRLESYEDTLNNLELKRTSEQDGLFKDYPGLREEYLLSYMLDLETSGSASLLNLDYFNDPFNYRLKIARHQEVREETVDLVETFNYLIGLRVQHIEPREYFTAAPNKRASKPGAVKLRKSKGDQQEFIFQHVVGTNAAGEKVLVIWRTLSGDPVVDNAALDAYFDTKEFSARDNEFDCIYVNGDNNMANLSHEENGWKVLLIEEEFKRLMFDVQDV